MFNPIKDKKSNNIGNCTYINSKECAKNVVCMATRVDNSKKAS